METKDYDVVIIGAGPAGCTCAYQLSKSGLRVAIIDKSAFPRDKICGDALSADVVNQFYKIDDELAKQFVNLKTKKASHGVRFFAPNGSHLDIDFINKNHTEAAGFIVKRLDFDAFYFNQIKDLKTMDVFENQNVLNVQDLDDKILIKTDQDTFSTTMLIGADGANSIVNRKLSTNTLNKHHHCAGLRQYYKNVSGCHPDNHIELHFYKDILPGYFWIFPLPNNQANVGLGMLSSAVSNQNINLKNVLKDIIANHPNIKDRFANAEPLENIKGFGLPIGSKKKQLSGNRFVLLGDAANLIDPFTGEGIGNAMRSGRIAAEHVKKAFKLQLFNANFNKAYDKEVYQKMWKELRISRSLQMLLKYPKLFNFIVKKANNNASLKTLLSSMLDDVDMKKELLKPSFYMKLIFN